MSGAEREVARLRKMVQMLEASEAARMDHIAELAAACRAARGFVEPWVRTSENAAVVVGMIDAAVDQVPLPAEGANIANASASDGPLIKVLDALEPGEPCEHPGCAAHVSHPCEGCGRYGAGLLAASAERRTVAAGTQVPLPAEG